MQTTHNENKTVLRIPLDLSNILEGYRVELPKYIILETCDSITHREQSYIQYNAEIIIHNYIESGIKLIGTIIGSQGDKVDNIEFHVDTKSNTIIGGWDYSRGNEIEIDVIANLPNDQKIHLLNNYKIPLETRFKQLIFYS